MSEIRVGIVGFGHMGREHARYIAAGEVPGARLSAVSDAFPGATESARAAHPGVAVFDSAEALFASGEVDAVLVTTPHYSHPPLAIAALQRGLHVLIEKPAGAYSKQVQEMNEIAANSDRVFGIMFNMRTGDAYRKMHEMVASGELGEVRRTHYVITDWFRTQAYYNSGSWRATWEGEGGGVLLNQSPHDLDLWQWICGMPKRVRAFCRFGHYHDIEVEDDVTAYVEYENGATGVFITSTGESPGARALEIVGDRGRLVLENNKLNFWRTTSSVDAFARESKAMFVHPEHWHCEIPTGGGEGHAGITRNWMAAIREGAPLLAPGREGINSVELANAMLLSTWTDSWIDLPLDGELYYQHLRQHIEKSPHRQESGGSGGIA